jgi:FixJ family two-component response regulator
VVLDRTMPDISGDQVFDEILRLDPSARVVLVSGFSEERAAASFPERGVAGFLKKPFLPESLIERVRQALSS